ncbi:hypothetical protein EU527_19465, partial [Candidatus Thorarchaeota archaeon]
TNDASAATSKAEAKDYMKRMKLPQLPDHQWFRNTLESLVHRLQKETCAKIALLSIPPIGENSEHPAFKLSSEYSKTIENIASSAGITYLPLHEKMTGFLAEHPGEPKYPLEKFKIEMIKALFKRYIMRKSWNDIGQEKGFQIHIDYLHLNTTGARFVVDLIERFLRDL